jgi:hypothetical protein
MEGDRKNQVQLMRRCFESSRVEEELWSLAYERLWPLIRARTCDRGNHAARRSASPLALAKGA